MAKRLTIEEFIKRSNKIHNNKYDYSLVNYINTHTKIKIICPIHKIFEQIPKSHLIGKGCNKCKYENSKKTTKKFIEQSKKIHGDLYDYSLVNYKNYKTKVDIICGEHGVFSQLPYNHCLGANGCPFCTGHKNIKFKEKKLYIFYDKTYSLYKIGFSQTPKIRIKRLKMDTKSDLIVIKIYNKLATIESNVHKMLKMNRLNHPIKHNGYTEWFNLDNKKLNEIISFVDTYNNHG